MKEKIRLNKYIAHAGICSRRQADIYISSGSIKVNNKIITELGFKVSSSDAVHFDGVLIKSEKPTYILLNKPKGFITTTIDERGRKTVMDLISKASKNRLYPVGRLDRKTTGLLLLTNDGDLSKKLTHPSSEIKKLYHVVLDKAINKNDFLKIKEGINLKDGFIKPDELNYVNGKFKNEIGISLHSGKNRIVRRIFEFLNYNVVKLDRVIFAGLTKKNLPRGNWRKLSLKEVGFLKMLPQRSHPHP